MSKERVVLQRAAGKTKTRPERISRHDLDVVVEISPPQSAEDFVVLALERANLDDIVKILRDWYGSKEIRQALKRLHHRDPVSQFKHVYRHAVEIYAKKHGLTPASLMVKLRGIGGRNDPAGSERYKLRTARGYVPILLDGKKPATVGWQKIKKYGDDGLEKLTNLFPDANIGVKTGELVAIDIDCEYRIIADQVAEAATEILGFSDYIRVGRQPRQAIFYNTADPTRKQSFGNVEVLGVGQQMAVLGTHPGTGNPYHWPLESIVDTPLEQLPRVSAGDIEVFLKEACRIQGLDVVGNRLTSQASELPTSNSSNQGLDVVADRPTSQASGFPAPGHRNVSLFLHLKDAAFGLDDIVQLRSLAHELNGHYPVPLSEAEVEKTACKVWEYKSEGRLLIRGRQSIFLPFGKDQIIGFGKTPDVIFFLALLKASRRGPTFTIPQQATAKVLGCPSPFGAYHQV